LDSPPPPPAVVTRASLGLPLEGPLFLVPQTLYKIHPDFDEMLGQLLRASPTGHAIFLEGQVPEWTKQLLGRSGQQPDACNS
jgi:protein O-GlcNAc transferase